MNIDRCRVVAVVVMMVMMPVMVMTVPMTESDGAIATGRFFSFGERCGRHDSRQDKREECE